MAVTDPGGMQDDLRNLMNIKWAVVGAWGVFVYLGGIFSTPLFVLLVHYMRPVARAILK